MKWSLTAFAQGDKTALKNLLSREVYDGFANAIDDREKAGEKLESRFVGIDKAEFVGRLSGRKARHRQIRQPIDFGDHRPGGRGDRGRSQANP